MNPTCDVKFNQSILDTILTQDERTEFVREEVTSSNIGIQNGNDAVVDYITSRLSTYGNMEIVSCANADPFDWSGAPIPEVPVVNLQFKLTTMQAYAFNIDVMQTASPLPRIELLAAIIDRYVTEGNTTEEATAFVESIEASLDALNVDGGDFSLSELDAKALYDIYGDVGVSDYVFIDDR